MMHTKEDFERAGRQKKVFAIVSILIKGKITAVALERADDTDWEAIHAASKIKKTSAETRRMVLEKLREHEAQQASAPTQDDIRDGEAASKDRAYRRERMEEMD